MNLFDACRGCSLFLQSMIVALSKLTELDRIEREAFEAVGYALSSLEQVS